MKRDQNCDQFKHLNHLSHLNHFITTITVLITRVHGAQPRDGQQVDIVTILISHLPSPKTPVFAIHSHHHTSVHGAQPRDGDGQQVNIVTILISHLPSPKTPFVLTIIPPVFTAPSHVTVMAYCDKQPNFIAAGCNSGQVVTIISWSTISVLCFFHPGLLVG